MKRPLLLLGLFLMLSTTWLNAQMKELKFEKYTLDNGLTVLLHKNNSAPTATVNVLYHVGSKNEKPGRSGFAHFFEHLMFEGSENIDRGEFDKYLTSVGGILNAGTSFDFTNYFETVPSNQLELALWLESERMLHAKVDEKGIETQREVVKEERRSRYDNQPYNRWQEEVCKRIFKATPYAITPIGTMEDINAATKEDFVQFYEDFYRPDNAFLSVVGDIDITETKKLIKKYFGTITNPKAKVYRPTVKIQKFEKEMVDTFYDRIQIPAIFLAYPSPAQYSKDYYAMEMLNSILAAGNSSRIYRSLVDEKQLALQAVSFQLAFESTGANVILGLSNIGVDLDAVKGALDEEIERIKTELISEKEFQKIRNQRENAFVSNIANNATIATNLVTYEAFQGDANLINSEINRYLEVTREDIKRVANKYLNKDHRLTLYWLAESSK